MINEKLLTITYFYSSILQNYNFILPTQLPFSSHIRNFKSHSVTPSTCAPVSWSIHPSIRPSNSIALFSEILSYTRATCSNFRMRYHPCPPVRCQSATSLAQQHATYATVCTALLTFSAVRKF